MLFFSISWERFGFFWEYAHIFLIILWWLSVLKSLWGYYPLLGADSEFSFLGEGTFSVFFSISWKMFGMFYEVLQKYSWYYCGNQTQNNITCSLYFARLLWITLGHIVAYYTVLIALRNPKYSPNVLQRFSGH